MDDQVIRSRPSVRSDGLSQEDNRWLLEIEENLRRYSLEVESSYIPAKFPLVSTLVINKPSGDVPGQKFSIPGHFQIPLHYSLSIVPR